MIRTATGRWVLAIGAAALATSGAFASPGDDDSMGGPPAPPTPPSAPATPAPPAGEDVLVLKDGTEIRGRITAEDDSGYAIKVGGSNRLVEKEKVQEVRRGAPAAAPEGDPSAKGGGAPATPDEKERKRRKAQRAEGAMDQEKAAPLSADAEAWGRICIERALSAGDEATRRSASEAIRALGPAAVPLIRQAREGADEKGKTLLDRITESMARGNGRKKGPDGGPPAVPPGLEKKGVMERPGPRAMMDRVRTELGLEDDALRTVGIALFQFGREVRETMSDARDGLVSYEEARTKVGEMRGKLRENLRPTLTEEQLAKLDVILDDMAAKRPGAGAPPAKPKEPAPPEPPAK
jgi:hypothetical protein